MAWGAPEALRKLEAWLHHGPPLARVSKVECVLADVGEAAGFRIG